MKSYHLLAATTLLLVGCAETPEEKKAIMAVEQHVRQQIGSEVKTVHSEAHTGHQEDAQGRNRSGHTVEYTFELERTPGEKEEVTTVYFADSAGNVTPSTK
ncbi:hypothetical protein [Hymenobacter elongatus]|uniref:PepSY domain-containing protein n=1 Tax=Hymenobacter elongatus TaxID=877208 RepID=A0A4Z0PK45_9BACT|nr:hypothetical protein [Hymenobacter elongatus]TGE15467.1 hypothetical protein E5J99_12775 [Hymenobacter elongatus]